jgi:hypothetical protein
VEKLEQQMIPFIFEWNSLLRILAIVIAGISDERATAAFSSIFAPPCPRLRGKSSPCSSFTLMALRPSSYHVPVRSHRYFVNDGEPITAVALLEARMCRGI